MGLNNHPKEMIPVYIPFIVIFIHLIPFLFIIINCKYAFNDSKLEYYFV